jgi:alkylation response protein AidB-like acyl-CoA dehydrogenase
VLNEAGQPRISAVCLPAEDWQVHDTWYVTGLKATGSNDIELSDKAVPAANMAELGTSSPCVPGPLYPVIDPLVPFFHSAPALGIAEAIVDDLIALAQSGRQQLMAPTRMRDSETFQFELGRIVTDLRATQAYCQTEAQDVWRHVVAGTFMDDGLRPTKTTQAAIWITESCVRIADACFALAGASAVYDSSPLQRRLRDLHVVAQHAMVQRRRYADIGKLLLASGAKGPAAKTADAMAAP